MSATDLGRTPPAVEREDATASAAGAGALAVYLLLGIAFGILLIKSEVISWFRIQEMFRFQSFHMYGILGSAVAVAAVSLDLMRRFGARTFYGEPIRLERKPDARGFRYAGGGLIFGFGWALSGTCPGPIMALVGYGMLPYLVVLVAALIGTYTYALVRPSLPH
jgi:uncharacterized protein